MLSRVLVTGSTGFIGRHVALRLAQKGSVVVAASRKSHLSLPEGVIGEVLPNLFRDISWDKVLRGVDTVIHCANYTPGFGESVKSMELNYQQVNVSGTQSLAVQSAEAGVRRFIYLSSIKVHGELSTPGNPVHELSQIAPVDAYARSKVAAEAALRLVGSETSMSIVILRPPLVYGAGSKGNLASLMHWIKSGRPLPLGAISDNRRSLISVENLVDAITHCAEHPMASGQTFVVSDGEDISTTTLLRAIGNAVGRDPRLISVPPGLLRAASTLAGQKQAATRLLGSLQVDARRIRGVTGWKPKMKLREGLQSMADNIDKRG